MRIICGILFLLCLILAQSSKGLEGETEPDQFCQNSHQMEEECGVYAHRIIKPMMAYFDQVNQKMEKNDLEIEGKSKKINELEEEGIQFRVDMASYTSKDKIIKLLEEKDESNKKLIKYLENMTEKQTKEIIELKAIVAAESAKALKCEAELINRNEKTKTPVQEKRSCIASNSSEVHTVSICNTFEVLCDSDIAGPGWTVIQQRIGSGVDFYRDWNEYKNGFGDSWNQDFFLGLEKIHRLTNDQPHELYIHMQKFDGSTFFARYHEFAISCEDDQYRLNKKFSTYDRDNDLSTGNCAKLHHGGWWHAQCTNTNLNGKYFNTEVQGKGTKVKESESIYWYPFFALKQVRMMIRPTSE